MTDSLPESDTRRTPKGKNPFAAAIRETMPKSAEGLHFPDVTGLSLLDAALAYAEAGWYVLPTNPAVNIKSPGSVVGGKWHEKSSRDPDRIGDWWSDNPNYGIALHIGRSGAGVFDLDQDSLDVVAAYGRADLADALVPPRRFRARVVTVIAGTTFLHAGRPRLR